jgi:tRNA/tmRNA/rRNA uracil-C5-methylase (TrmA/RlmC/RlmD family)
LRVEASLSVAYTVSAATVPEASPDTVVLAPTVAVVVLESNGHGVQKVTRVAVMVPETSPDTVVLAPACMCATVSQQCDNSVTTV